MLVLAGTAGGVGCTVAAVAVALHSGRARPTLLVDLRGDVGAALGGVEVEHGLDEWLQAPDPPPDALGRIEMPVGDGVALLAPSGAGGPIDQWLDLGLLAELLTADGRTIVVDAGPLDGVAGALLERAATVVAITRLCHLAFDRSRRLVDGGLRVDSVVAVVEPGRLLTVADAAEALAAPVVARVRWDPAVAAAIDRGVFLHRPPARLKPLRALVG